MKQAASFKLGICEDPTCRALHFELQDERGKPFAQMNVNVRHVPEMIEEMKSFAYTIVTMKE